MKKVQKYNYVTVFAALFLLLSFFAAQAAPIGTSVENGSQSSYSPSSTGGNVNITAGGTKEANFSSIGSTSKWAGFYGNIKGFVILADAGENQFLNWTISDPSGSYLYASTASSLTWPSGGTWTAADADDAPAYVRSNAADNYNNTFKYLAATAVSTPEYTIPQYTNESRSFSSTGTESTTLITYALVDDGSNFVLASPITNDASGYDGSTVDYQMVVPVDGTNTGVYYFWLELA